MADPNIIGYVVIEWSQASRQPSLAADVLYDNADEAADLAEQCQTDTDAAGRRDRFTVHEVTR